MGDPTGNTPSRFPRLLVAGVGVGYRSGRERELALVVMVKQKLPRTQLQEEDLLPAEIDGVPVDVRAVGELRADNAEAGAGD